MHSSHECYVAQQAGKGPSAVAMAVERWHAACSRWQRCPQTWRWWNRVTCRRRGASSEARQAGSSCGWPGSLSNPRRWHGLSHCTAHPGAQRAAAPLILRVIPMMIMTMMKMMMKMMALTRTRMMMSQARCAPVPRAWVHASQAALVPGVRDDGFSGLRKAAMCHSILMSCQLWPGTPAVTFGGTTLPCGRHVCLVVPP